MCIGDCNDKLDRVQYHPWTHERSTVAAMNICGRENINFDIIAANVGSPKNQKSIVLKATAEGIIKTKDEYQKVVYKRVVCRSVLLAGDIEGDAAETVAKVVPGRLKSDVYQISHHGACTQANKCEWLKAIQPQEAFVSHAYNGKYDHPRCDAIENLLSLGTIQNSSALFHFTHPHPFTCSKTNPKRVSTGETCYHIFGTYPTENTICTVRFILGVFPATHYRCYPADKPSSLTHKSNDFSLY